MPKYFKASITVTQVFEIEVFGESESDASDQAWRSDLKSRTPISERISGVKLEFIGESTFDVGSKVEHRIFGKGFILEMKRMTDFTGKFINVATIQFEDGSTKNIILSLPKETLKLLY